MRDFEQHPLVYRAAVLTAAVHHTLSLCVKIWEVKKKKTSLSTTTVTVQFKCCAVLG